MRFGLDIAQQRLEWQEIESRAHFAEDAGFDGVWGFDHFQPMYGEGPGPCFEGWTTLAALAGSTSSVRLGLLVTGNTYRHPSLLASEVVTVDHASSGRVELSLGAAWFGQEHQALGWEFPDLGERIERLEESLQVINLLFSGESVSFSGRHYQLQDAQMLPKPVQEPRPPIWIGAGGERKTIPLAARYADAWHALAFGGIADLRRKSRILDEHAEKAGRDPAAILRAASLSIDRPVDETRSEIDELREAGFGYLIVGWPSGGLKKVEEFVGLVFQ